MHRVLSHHDTVFSHVETHGTAEGVSIGVPYVSDYVNAGGRLAGSGKVAETVELPTGCPMGLGHDGGPLRVHILVDKNPTGNSAIASAVATATSSIKPHFSAHKVQVNVSGAMLPTTTEPIPLGVLAATICGTPDTPNLMPLFPCQTTVLSGMTIGDIIGGFVNYITEAIWSKIMDIIGSIIGLFLPGMDTVLGIATKVQGFVFDNFKLGPSNLGVVAQQAIDQDGVGHDAHASAGVGTLGYVEYNARTHEVDAHWGPVLETLAVGSLLNPMTAPIGIIGMGSYHIWSMMESS